MENYHLQEVKKTINGPMSIAMLICWRVPMVGKPFGNLNPEEIDFRENRIETPVISGFLEFLLYVSWKILEISIANGQ